MILFIKIILCAGVIAFPIVKSYFKGVVEFFWVKGIIFGLNYDSMYFGTKDKDNNESVYKLHNFQFHLLCATVTMSFSVKANDIEIHKE